MRDCTIFTVEHIVCTCLCYSQSERRFSSELRDLRDRIEQSHNTNRSLQSYVDFLKNSYSATFSDSLDKMPTTAANQRSANVDSATRTLHR